MIRTSALPDSPSHTTPDVVSLEVLRRRLWRGRYLLLAGTLIGAAIGFLAASATPVSYEAVSTVLVRQAAAASPAVATNSMRAVIANQAVAAEVVKQTALPLTPQQFLDTLRIEDVPGTYLMRIFVRAADADTAARAANLATSEAIKLNGTLMGTGADRLQRVMEEELAEARRRMNQSELELTAFRRNRRLGQTSAGPHEADIEESRLHAAHDLATRLYEEIAVQYGKLRLQVAEQAAELMVIEAAYPPDNPMSARRGQRTVFAALTGLTLTALLLILVFLFAPARPRAG